MFAVFMALIVIVSTNNTVKQFPFPDVDKDSDESKKILKLIILQIRSESYNLIQLMIFALRLSNQILHSCLTSHLPVGTSPEARLKLNADVVMVLEEVMLKIRQK
jgi:hypothetical protein